jgi:hypothetical protein
MPFASRTTRCGMNKQFACVLHRWRAAATTEMCVCDLCGRLCMCIAPLEGCCNDRNVCDLCGRFCVCIAPLESCCNDRNVCMSPVLAVLRVYCTVGGLLQRQKCVYVTRAGGFACVLHRWRAAATTEMCVCDLCGRFCMCIAPLEGCCNDRNVCMWPVRAVLHVYCTVGGLLQRQKCVYVTCAGGFPKTVFF